MPASCITNATSFCAGPSALIRRSSSTPENSVSSAEPTWDGAALDDRVPERDRVLRHDHQLDAPLARVAGAVDHDLDTRHLTHLPREGRALVEAEAFQGPGPLDGEERELVGLVAQV